MFLLFLFHENIISGLFLDVFHILHYTDFGKIILMKRKFKRNLWIFVHRNWDSLKFRFISIFNKIPNIYLMEAIFRLNFQNFQKYSVSAHNNSFKICRPRTIDSLFWHLTFKKRLKEKSFILLTNTILMIQFFVNSIIIFTFSLNLL